MKGNFVVFERPLAPRLLLLKGTHVRREQAVERKAIPLVIRKRGTFVEPGVIQEVVSGEPGPDPAFVRHPSILTHLQR